MVFQYPPMDLDAKSATETNQTSGYSGSNSESPIFSTHTAYSETPLVRHGNTPSSPVDSAGPRPAIVEEEPDKVRGWPRLAQKMAEKRGLESFARFRELNIKNLFYYQAELATLQCQLKFIEDDDAGKYTYAKDAGELMCPLDATEEPQAREQRDLVLKIRTLLKDYNEAFCLYRQMSEAPAPDPRNVETVHAWLTRHDLGGNCIGGMGSDTWGKPYGAGPEEQTIARRLLLLPFRLFWPRQFAEVDKLDLVTVPPRQKPDAFVNWISHEFVPLYHDIVGYLRPSSPQEDEETAQDRADRKKKEKERRERKKKERREQEQKEKERRKNDGFVTYSGSRIGLVASSVATVIACILPTISIGILATATGMVERLLYIGGFTALFAIGLLFLTDAATSRVQIFTATAAFSAVLVVFVQNG